MFIKKKTYQQALDKIAELEAQLKQSTKDCEYARSQIRHSSTTIQQYQDLEKGLKTFKLKFPSGEEAVHVGHNYEFSNNGISIVTWEPKVWGDRMATRAVAWYSSIPLSIVVVDQ